ncbi:MAG TPA: exodeoxyribonuclease VII large subunit, partial [Allosphingosinicella sp.]
AERLQALWRVAELAHPNRPLERGYARVEDRSGRTVTSAAAAREARLLKLVFSDDALEASVGDASTPRPRRPGLTKIGPDQPKLF